MSPGRTLHTQQLLPPGLLTSLLLGIVQSLLIVFVPVDLNSPFLAILPFMLLLYLLVPFLRSLLISGDKRIARRIWLLCAGLATFAPIITHLVATLNTPVVESGGFSGLRLAGDNFVALVALCLLNAVGFALALFGGWLGGMRQRRAHTRALRRAAAANTAAPRIPPARGKRWPPYVIMSMVMSMALAVSIILELIVVASYPQGFLSTLIALQKAPAYATYPYGANLRAMVSASSDMLYTGAIPESYVLRASDGAVVQHVPEQLFAAAQGILLTESSISDLQGGRLVVRAYRQSDGQPLWSSSLEDAQQPELLDGILYLTTESQFQQPGQLQAIDPATGHVLWHYHCPTAQCHISLPQILNQIAYVTVLGDQSGGYSLRALQARTGTLLWQVPLYTYAQPPLVAGNRLIVQTDATTITAIRATDCHILWQQQMNFGTSLSWSGAAVNSSIALIQLSATVYALRLDTGAIQWQWQASANSTNSAVPLLTTTTVYLATTNTLFALDSSTGKVRWQQMYPDADTINQEQHPPDDLAILGEFNGLLALDLTRRQASDRIIAVLREDTGALVWQRDVGASVMLAQRRDVRLTNLLPAIITAGEPVPVSNVVTVFQSSGAIYVVSNQMTSSVLPVHYTIFEGSAPRTIFNTTTFTLTTQALDGQTGNMRWQNQQTQTFQVA